MEATVDETTVYETITAQAIVGEKLTRTVEEAGEMGETIITDDDDNPIFYAQGPVVTEILMEPAYEYYDVLQTDESGEPLHDGSGDPVYKAHKKRKLDSQGEHIHYPREVAVENDDGELIRKDTFVQRAWSNNRA